MLEAVLSVILTLVIIAVAVYAFIRIKGKSGDDFSLKGNGARTIETVGIGSKSHKDMLSNDAPTVATHRTPSGAVGSRLRNRFTAMWVLLAAVFGSIAVKLWTMQILNGEEYARQAQENTYTNVKTPAPRGIIYDREGVALVDNSTSLTILAEADVASNRDVIRRLSTLLGVPFSIVRQRIQDTSNGVQSQRIVAEDVNLRDIAFIVEHPDAFPGVTTQSRTKRRYPYGSLAAHALGYTGTITEAQLSRSLDGREFESGDVVGQAGIEEMYDDILTGDAGVRTLVVDSSGTVQQVVAETSPTRGNDIRLTIQAGVQQAADQALSEMISGKFGKAGAAICMDCTNGEILAMANFPSFLPETFIGGISQDVWDAFNTTESYYPLMNRAIAGTYPPASTFKSFSGMAGLEYGFADASRTWVCTGVWTGFGEGSPQKCWQEYGHGTLDFRQAIVESCDTVFYEIAKDFYDDRQNIGLDAMQNYIKQFGFENTTGIDLAGEATGRIPTPEWKEEYYKDIPEEADWKPGDMSNMVIGQGYVLVTPIELAVAYGQIAADKKVTPHLLKEVRNSIGQTVVEAPVQVEQVSYKQENLDLVKSGLRGVVTESSEVSSYFGDLPVAGKTGTAEFTDKKDHAWFACYGPYEDPKYVTVVIIEEGVAGSSAAAPVAAKIMEAALAYSEGKLENQMTYHQAGVTPKSTDAAESSTSGRVD